MAPKSPRPASPAWPLWQHPSCGAGPAGCHHIVPEIDFLQLLWRRRLHRCGTAVAAALRLLLQPVPRPWDSVLLLVERLTVDVVAHAWALGRRAVASCYVVVQLCGRRLLRGRLWETVLRVFWCIAQSTRCRRWHCYRCRSLDLRHRHGHSRRSRREVSVVGLLTSPIADTAAIGIRDPRA